MQSHLQVETQDQKVENKSQKENEKVEREDEGILDIDEAKSEMLIDEDAIAEAQRVAAEQKES
jgi:hypothetical protein